MIVLDVQVQTEPKGRGHWRLYGIGDPHLEKRTHHTKAFRQYVAQIASDPYSLAICVGDVFDVTLPGHKFYDAGTQRADVVAAMDVYVNKMVEEAVASFAPILKAGIPFVCAEGNHDIRLHGVNVIQLLVSQLNDLAVRQKWTGRAYYAGGEAIVRVRAPIARRTLDNANIWTVYVAHGTGGGFQPGGKVNRATWQAHICDADVYLRGHVEEGDVRIVDRYAVTLRGEARLVRRPVCYYTAAGYGTRRIPGIVDYAGRKSLPPVDRRIKWLNMVNPEAVYDKRTKTRRGIGPRRIVEVQAPWT